MELDLEKLNKKRLYKFRGVVSEFKWITPTLGSLIVTKGSGKTKQLFKFTVLSKEAREICQLLKGYRIKIWFKIKTREFKSSLYTELIIQYFEYWPVNEDKKRKEEVMAKRNEEHQYSKPIQQSFGNTEDFLNEGFNEDWISNG